MNDYPLSMAVVMLLAKNTSQNDDFRTIPYANTLLFSMTVRHYHIFLCFLFRTDLYTVDVYCCCDDMDGISFHSVRVGLEMDSWHTSSLALHIGCHRSRLRIFCCRCQIRCLPTHQSWCVLAFCWSCTPKSWHGRLLHLVLGSLVNCHFGTLFGHSSNLSWYG